MSQLLAHLSRLVSRPLELPVAPPQRADAIVVLGSPLDAAGRLSAACAERVAAGAELFHQGRGPLLVLSGRGEAEAMARRAADLGVPESALLVENLSRNTRENAERSAELLRPVGARRVWVVSQPFHLRRAAYWFRRAGLEPLPYADPQSLQRRRSGLALRWSAREYAAWIATAWRSLRRRSSAS